MSAFFNGQQFAAGPGLSTVVPDFDFETYSEAGYRWDDEAKKWRDPLDAPKNKRGISLVGAATYAEHPTTEPLLLRYDFKDGYGSRVWRKGEAPPLDLFGYLAAGGVIEAFNWGFEFEIWNRCCVPKLGWPPLNISQLRCAQAKARAFSLPGKLEIAAADALKLPPELCKSPGGDSLIKLFCTPQNPVKKFPDRRRIFMHDAPDKAREFEQYNAQDIVAEEAVSVRCPDLSPDEFALWQLDQRINVRGVAVDVPLVNAACKIIREARTRYNGELFQLTNGAVKSVSEGAKLIAWLHAWGVHTDSVDEENTTLLLARNDLQPHVRRALEIRQQIAGSAVSKLFALAAQTTAGGRLHHLFGFHAARTGRWTGNGPQPQNLPSSGPDVCHCACGIYFTANVVWCPYCNQCAPTALEEWGPEAAAYVNSVIMTGSLATMETLFGRDVVPVVAGCLRSMFVAADGHDLIASDFSAIEAVVLAALAGEQWRLDVFHTHGKIYEMSASKITGTPFEEYEKYKRENGKHHPDRKSIGKVAELASGYKGWLNAWLNFGAGDFFNDREIKQKILAWRAASPMIEEFWGGQFRGLPWDDDRRPEMFGIEGCAVSAVINPGTAYTYRDIGFQMLGDALYCRLPSGRLLTYHRPRLTPSFDKQGRDAGLSLSYEGYNTNSQKGPPGWVRINTHGGMLTENIVQAVARDILKHAMLQLDAAGYPIVLHVHDEIVAEVLHGWGSVDEFERIALSNLPPWCATWPIRISGGWRGRNYRK